MAGAGIPLAMTFIAPVAVETEMIVVAVVLSLAITSAMAARLGKQSAMRMLARSLIVGLTTMGVSYLAGLLLR